ncbi:hypothetical protein CBW56_16650 [Denitratisoma oestradiolicum]|nr:hypothetical protein CBW56_16650 [Denitratisoma oestradiolicum]
MGQVAILEELADRFWKWHQATLVNAIEHFVFDVNKSFLEVEETQGLERIPDRSATRRGKQHDNSECNERVVKLNRIVEFA